MITTNEIRQKAEKLYLPALRAWLLDEPFFPREIAFRKPQPSEQYLALREATARLIDESKARRGRGYSLELHTRQTQRYGQQSLPARIVLESEDDLFWLVGKAREAATFKLDVMQIRSSLPELAYWLPNNLPSVIDQAGNWSELIHVCRYLLEHPRPACYLRELPVPVHTKFVEEHRGILRRLLDALLPPSALLADETRFESRYGLRYDEPIVRLRILDQTLQLQLGLPISDISVPLSQIAQLRLAGSCCVITENKMTFLTLPELPGCFALFGGGFALELLKQVPWLGSCPLLYWGDIDAQGFQILSQLRAFQPHSRSVLMDESTFERFEQWTVAGSPCAVTQLPGLSETEHSLFLRLARSERRLEQERIQHDVALSQLRLGVALLQDQRL